MSNDLAIQVEDALRLVIDPELGHDIVSLGLIYDIAIVDGAVCITMTATTPGCPAIGFLKDAVTLGVSGVPDVESVAVIVTFEPRWTPDRMNLAARTALGFAAVN